MQLYQCCCCQLKAHKNMLKTFESCGLDAQKIPLCRPSAIVLAKRSSGLTDDGALLIKSNTKTNTGDVMKTVLLDPKKGLIVTQDQEGDLLPGLTTHHLISKRQKRSAHSEEDVEEEGEDGDAEDDYDTDDDKDKKAVDAQETTGDNLVPGHTIIYLLLVHPL